MVRRLGGARRSYCSAVGASERCDATAEAGTITVPVFARYKTIDYPRDAEGELSGMIHQTFVTGKPLFASLGEIFATP